MQYSAPLDGLRGIAIITVMLAHFGVPGIQRGGFGVDMFFTLSGFLITSVLLSEYRRYGDISFKNFYMRRLLRLLPALLCLLCVYGLAMAFIGKNISRHVVDIALVFFYVANWAAATGLNRPGELGHTWSLSVEEQFYLLWPALLLLFLRKWGGRGIIYGSALLAGASMLETFSLATSVPWSRLYYGFDTRAFTLLLGCWFAAIYHFHGERIRLPLFAQRLLPVVTSMGVVLFMCRTDSFTTDPYFFRCGIFVMPLLTCGLLYQIAMPGFERTKKVLGPGWLVYFGKRSYGLYLWHYWIMNFWLMDISKADSFGVRIGWAVLSLVVAELSFRYVETPFLSLKDRFTFKGRGAVEASPASERPLTAPASA